MTHAGALRRCVLLPIDSTGESLKSVPFLTHLYPPQRDIVQIILALIVPPIPPVYCDKATSQEEKRRQKEFLRSRDETTRSIVKHAREVLEATGFPSEHIVEQVQEKETSLGKQACLLAHVRRADAVVIPQRMSSRLEAFLRDDPTTSFIHHCIANPVWLTEGHIDPSTAVVCLEKSAAALRAVDHAAFMLSKAVTNRIILLRMSTSALPGIIRSPAEPFSETLNMWITRDEEGFLLEPVLRQSVAMMHHAGIENERLEIRIVPSRGKVAEDIWRDCRAEGAGIIVLGHEGEGGSWSFFKDSVTRRLLSEMKDTALWIVQ